jgi:hypothetical protein
VNDPETSAVLEGALLHTNSPASSKSDPHLNQSKQHILFISSSCPRLLILALVRFAVMHVAAAIPLLAGWRSQFCIPYLFRTKSSKKFAQRYILHVLAIDKFHILVPSL